MKTIVLKNRFAALAAALAGIMALTSCEEHRINESRLPDAAQEFISQLSQVPDGIVPAQILSHLQTYVPGGTKVFSIEKKWGGYEIGIQDGRDLIYDADGQFVREDR